MIAPVGMIDDRGGLDHLGPEFLTWLWWRADEDPGFTHADGQEVFVLVDEHLEFRGERAASRRTVLRAGAPSASVEARAALRSGKMLVAARLILARGEHESAFTLRSEDMDVSGLKLPQPSEPKGMSPQERLAEGIENLERFWDDLDLCYATFLDRRTGEAWPEDVEKMRTWSARPSQDEGGVPRRLVIDDDIARPRTE